MEFGSNKEEFCQDDHHHQHNNQTGKAKLHFSHNSSSSSSPSSLVPCFDNLWNQQTGCWLGIKEHQDDHKNEESDHHAMVAVEEEGRSTGSVVSMVVEKEHMFDKVVTPSDVGKLNRLVIPKQHAEKYFPLDSAANEKGLLLNFEDRNGKPWRFRYSYWNSSQSYVMTKGWSRFVKDKKLDAGDIVSFQRGVGELGKDRLYIDWRRRPDAPEPVSFPLHHHHHHLSFHRSIPWSPLLMRPPPPSSVRPMSRDHLHLSQMNHFLNRNGFCGGGSSSGGGGGGMGSVYYLRSQPLQSHPLQMGMSMGEWQHHHHQYQHQQHYHHHHHQQQQAVLQQEENTMVFDSVPVVQGKAAAKRLRLFGVNMDCPISDTTTTTSTTDDDENEIDTVLSSTTVQHALMPTIQQPHQHYLQQQVSSSQAAASHHQLRLYNGTAIDFLNKGKASMSFD